MAARSFTHGLPEAREDGVARVIARVETVRVSGFREELLRVGRVVPDRRRGPGELEALRHDAERN